MFVGVSTGRAGSKWIATVMSRAGIPTQHEQTWKANGPDWSPRWDLPAPIMGEWSAQVVPHLRDRPKGAYVFHQVRHPLRVVASFLEFGLFDRPNDFGWEGEAIMSHLELTGDRVTDVCALYVDWNKRCEVDDRRYRRWRVEDVTPRLVVRLGALLGVHVPFIVARDAVGSVPDDTNTQGPPVALSWSDIPGVWRDRLQIEAARYGYAR